MQYDQTIPHKEQKLKSVPSIDFSKIENILNDLSYLKYKFESSTSSVLNAVNDITKNDSARIEIQKILSEIHNLKNQVQLLDDTNDRLILFRFLIKNQ